METITFYSYKGGVGRTLLVANVAKYLAMFGQSVFALDFDLEAPGLHYKFMLAKEGKPAEIEKGVVDYIYDFAVGEGTPLSLQDYVVEIDRSEKSGGSIHLMPAGKVPSSSYWRRLARINWYDLFYSPTAQGIPFFLELKEHIEEEYTPDYLLIDSRTGVTEIGGVATTLLPDKVVCLLLNNRENLEGAREVLRSIKRTARLQGQDPVKVIPVLTRIPTLKERDIEQPIVDKIRQFLNEEAEDLTEILDIDQLFIIHSDPDLELSESLRVRAGKRPQDSPLLSDYLRLLSQFDLQDILGPFIIPLTQDIMGRALDDPERAQQELQALVDYFPHGESYRALLNFYLLRGGKDDVILDTAMRFWKVSGKEDEALLSNVVREHLSSSTDLSKLPCLPEFIEAIWSASAADVNNISLSLIRYYLDSKQAAKLDQLFNRLLMEGTLSNVGKKELLGFLENLVFHSKWDNASMLIDSSKELLADSKEFLLTWARVTVHMNDRLSARILLDTKRFSEEVFNELSSQHCVSLLGVSGRTQLAEDFVYEALVEALSGGSDRALRNALLTLEECTKYIGPAPSSRIWGRALSSARPTRTYKQWQSICKVIEGSSNVIEDQALRKYILRTRSIRPSSPLELSLYWLHRFLRR